MPNLSRWNLLYLLYLSKPKADRSIFRAMRGKQIRKILEIGIGSGLRAQRLIALATASPTHPPVAYTAIDPFEASDRAGEGTLSLKDAFCLLRATGARLKLVPGDPFSGLARAANQIGPVDLLVISAGCDSEALRRAWFYVPRTLHDGSLVFQERFTNDGTSVFDRLSVDEIRRWATPSRRCA